MGRCLEFRAVEPAFGRCDDATGDGFGVPGMARWPVGISTMSAFIPLAMKRCPATGIIFEDDRSPSARTATSVVRYARMPADQAAGRFGYHEAVRLRTAADRFGCPRARLIIVGELLQAYAFLSDKAPMRDPRAEALTPLADLLLDARPSDN